MQRPGRCRYPYGIPPTATGRSNSSRAPASRRAKCGHVPISHSSRRRPRPEPPQQRRRQHPAQHGAPGLHRLQPGIAAGKQHQFNAPLDLPPLVRPQRKIRLQADQPAALRTSRPTQIVLAGGQEHGPGLHFPKRPGLYRESTFRSAQPAHRMAPQHPRPRLGRTGQQRLVQHLPRQAQRRKRQRRHRVGPAMHQPHPSDCRRREPRQVHAQRRRHPNHLAAQEIAAHLVVRTGAALDDRHRAAGRREPDGGGGPGRSSAQNQRRHRRATQSRNGTCHVTCTSPAIPAEASSARHSAAVNARAIDICPSDRTNRCHRAAKASSGNP